MINRLRKLDTKTVQAIRAYHRLGYTCGSVAAVLNVGVATVKDVASRRTWADVPDVTQPPVGLRRIVRALRRPCFKRKLTAAMVMQIRAMARQGRSQRYIAGVIGISQPNVCYVLRGVIHRDVPDLPSSRNRSVSRSRCGARANLGTGSKSPMKYCGGSRS